MSFTVAGSWVWDFWTVYDESAGRHHLFYLHAPVSLGDPERRHRHARVGHASSSDLHRWRAHADPLPEPLDGLDDLATWTGCAVGDGERWWLFTSGLSRHEDGRVQRVGSAHSGDLETWQRTDRVLTADPQHYETVASAAARSPGATRGWSGATTASGTCTSPREAPVVLRAAAWSGTRPRPTWSTGTSRRH